MAKSLYPASVDKPDLTQTIPEILADLQAGLINVQNHLGITGTAGAYPSTDVTLDAGNDVVVPSGWVGADSANAYYPDTGSLGGIVTNHDFILGIDSDADSSNREFQVYTGKATPGTGGGTKLFSVSETGLTTLTSLSFGAAEENTVSSGVLTVTQSSVNVLPESSTTDTVDSITWTGVTEGAILLCRSEATNTITFDNSATLLLGAATRAVAPGGCLILLFHGTTWVELSFLAAAS